MVGNSSNSNYTDNSNSYTSKHSKQANVQETYRKRRPCSGRHQQQQPHHRKKEKKSKTRTDRPISPRTHLVRQGTDRRAKRACEPEICELELSVPADQQVLRLEVAAKAPPPDTTGAERTNESAKQKPAHAVNTQQRGAKQSTCFPRNGTR